MKLRLAAWNCLLWGSSLLLLLSLPLTLGFWIPLIIFGMNAGLAVLVAGLSLSLLAAAGVRLSDGHVGPAAKARFSVSVGPTSPSSASGSELPLFFSRTLPRWGTQGAIEDFDVYLRAQLGPALSVVASAPSPEAVRALFRYFISLFGERYPLNDALVSIRLPAGWEKPPAWKCDEQGAFYDYLYTWLKIRPQEGSVFEVAYQSFGQDLNVVRIPVAIVESEL